MKNGKVSATGALISLVFLAMLAGNAAAERVPCDLSEHMARGYSIDKLWEEAVSCARDRRITSTLQSLGRAHEAGTDYVPKDWRRAVEAYELVIDFNKDRAVPTYGSVIRADAVLRLVQNFSSGNGALGWPQDLERARDYMEQELSMLQLPAKPEFSENRSVFIERAQKELAEIDRQIAEPARNFVGKLSADTLVSSINPVHIGDYAIQLSSIEKIDMKSAPQLLQYTFDVFVKEPFLDDTVLCIRMSNVGDVPNRPSWDTKWLEHEVWIPSPMMHGQYKGWYRIGSGREFWMLAWPKGVSPESIRVEMLRMYDYECDDWAGL